MNEFLNGATMLACLAIGLFFFRYWRETRDRLLGIFAVAFWVFAVNRVLLLVLDDEAEIWVYVSRAAAFLLIILAIVDKNRAPAGRA
ncbi:MAG TPA: DUF5985 family protein [Gaiellaceae bacterium]|nr:DUF5985 family protein [Gaiellaceae bacterium]